MLQNATPLRKSALWPPNISHEQVFCTADPLQIHFDLEMCFAPQRRALFQHLNFQKWSEAEVFCTFWIGNMLRATTACTFSTSQLVKVVRSWCVLYMLTSKCASRHNGVQFFISHLASWLRTRRFSEPTFRPSRATNLSYLFAHLHLLSSGSFSSTLLSSNLSLLSASALLCFSSVHIVGSLTSKLPSINKSYIYFIPMVVIFQYIYIDIYTRILPDLPTEWVTCWTFFSCCGRRHAAVGGQCLTTAPANAGGGGDESDAT